MLWLSSIICCYRKIINFVLVIADHFVSGYITPPDTKYAVFYSLHIFKVSLIALQKTFCKDYFGNGTTDPKQWRNSSLSFLFLRSRQAWHLGMPLCRRTIRVEAKTPTEDDESRPLLNVLHWAWPIKPSISCPTPIKVFRSCVKKNFKSLFWRMFTDCISITWMIRFYQLRSAIG